MNNQYKLMCGWNRDYAIFENGKRITPWCKKTIEIIDWMRLLGLTFLPGSDTLGRQEAGLFNNNEQQRLQ